MNLGYHSDSKIPLYSEDEKDRDHLQLYQTILSQHSLSAKKVLEFSCGRGGGCYYFARYHDAKQVVGVDLSVHNVAICNSMNRLANVEFYVGDVHDFQLKPSSFDVVVNLEASHCYRDRLTFFQNVATLLNPNGYFYYADIFEKDGLLEIENLIFSQGLKMESKNEISQAVCASIKQNSAKWHPFTARFPSLVPGIYKNFQGMVGSDFYNKLDIGELVYVSYVFRKL